MLGVGAFLIGACGGSSTRTSAPPGDGDPSRAGGQMSGGSSNQGETSDASGASTAGGVNTGGVTVISSEPATCQTDDGREGIVVDTFPYPSPMPRCEALDQAGILDTSCPEEPRVTCVRNECLIDDPLAGCCRTDGACGVWDDRRFSTKKSLGCISREPWIENARWLGEAGEAVSCSPK